MYSYSFFCFLLFPKLCFERCCNTFIEFSLNDWDNSVSFIIKLFFVSILSVLLIEWLVILNFGKSFLIFLPARFIFGDIVICTLVSLFKMSFNSVFEYPVKILSLYERLNDALSLFINLLAKSSRYFIDASFLKSKLKELFW